MNQKKTRRIFRNWPVHVLLIILCALWLLPAFGLLVTSFRPFQEVNNTGWWTVLSPPEGQAEYEQTCVACHGSDGKQIATADLTNSDLIQKYRRSFALIALLKRDINAQPHMGTTPVPDEQTAANIATYLRGIGGADLARQCLKLGLLDEIGIDLVPVLLGQGVRLFEYLGVEPVELEAAAVSQSPGVIHISYRVCK